MTTCYTGPPLSILPKAECIYCYDLYKQEIVFFISFKLWQYYSVTIIINNHTNL